jgi:hypothetical protein
LGISNASIAFWYRITMEEKTWKHITLGELYRGGVAKFRRGRRAFKRYSPLKLDLTAAKNLWGAIAAESLAKYLMDFHRLLGEVESRTARAYLFIDEAKEMAKSPVLDRIIADVSMA